MMYAMRRGRILMLTDMKDKLEDDQLIALVSGREVNEACAYLGFPAPLIGQLLKTRVTRFESHDGMDVICAPILTDVEGGEEGARVVHIFLKQNSLLLVSEEKRYLKGILRQLAGGSQADVSFGRLLYEFFEKMVERDADKLSQMEQKVSALEDDVLLDRESGNFVQEIVTMRRQLRVLKRYYEQILDIFSYVEGNDNGFFDNRVLKAFRMLTGKVNRLYQGVGNLRDSVSQVREAYQAEVDIELNQTMKVFTVITTIFLPLTLIAGWFGMNFNMPEYASPYAYPAVILVSILVVVVEIIYFKKKKWF